MHYPPLNVRIGLFAPCVLEIPQRREARINRLQRLASTLLLVEILPTPGAQPPAVGAADRDHRHGQQQVLAYGFRDVQHQISPQRDDKVPGSQGPITGHCDVPDQEILLDRDGDVLPVLRQAPPAHEGGGGREMTSQPERLRGAIDLDIPPHGGVESEVLTLTIHDLVERSAPHLPDFQCRYVDAHVRTPRCQTIQYRLSVKRLSITAYPCGWPLGRAECSLLTPPVPASHRHRHPPGSPSPSAARRPADLVRWLWAAARRRCGGARSPGPLARSAGLRLGRDGGSVRPPREGGGPR